VVLSQTVVLEANEHDEPTAAVAVEYEVHEPPCVVRPHPPDAAHEPQGFTVHVL